MEILKKILKPRQLTAPCGLAIGSFDGVHLGHEQLLRYLREKIGEKATLGVITFSSHPSHLFNQTAPQKMIFSSRLKIQALEAAGVDVVFLLKFTHRFALQPYDIFLKKVKEAFPFEYLIFGEKSVLGKNREGTFEKIQALSCRLHFHVEYLPKFELKGEVVSSRLIRACIQEGDLTKAEKLLGHPFKIEGVLRPEIDSAYEATLETKGICLPPEGTYEAFLESKGKQTSVTAHLKKNVFFLSVPFAYRIRAQQQIFLTLKAFLKRSSQ